jgi:riboflavin kinase / FMN adenylyltransferase
MKLIRGYHNLPPSCLGAVVTIGTFDGIHQGHQALITACLQQAEKHQTTSILMTFEPYPQFFFSEDRRVPRLMSLRDKYRVLEKTGIDYLLVLPFNADLAEKSAEDFVVTLLMNALKTKAVVVGDDFRFGAKRLGDIGLLKRYSNVFESTQVPTLVYQGERVSSSRLRQSLISGDLSHAEQMLGRPYSLSGRIVKGDQRGRDFGFPTANIYVGQDKLPLSGIFVVEVEGLAQQSLRGVASVGFRPMYPTEKDMLEVYLFDFDQTVYYQYCTVIFRHRLRDEIKYDTDVELIAQIKQDVDDAQDYFKQ